MRLIGILVFSLVLVSTTVAQEFEVFTGDDPIGSLPKPKPVNYLAKCMAGDRLACEIFKSKKSEGGLEAGDIEQAEYIACNKKGGVCLELATLDLDAQDMPNDPKEHLPSIDINILFDYEKADIKNSEAVKLVQIVEALKDPVNAKAIFAIVGHTDAKGAVDYNCRLSTLRARSVSTRLAALGIAARRLVILGAGEYVLRDKQKPQAAQNRRVGFIRLAGKQNTVLDRLSNLCTVE